jgi:hypothetical protein
VPGKINEHGDGFVSDLVVFDHDFLIRRSSSRWVDSNGERINLQLDGAKHKLVPLGPRFRVLKPHSRDLILEQHHE